MSWEDKIKKERTWNTYDEIAETMTEAWNDFIKKWKDSSENRENWRQLLRHLEEEMPSEWLK